VNQILDPPLDGAVELLERSLSYTRVALADVGRDQLRNPTPCAGWTLARLLAHMEDALDAFTEAADGRVSVEPTPPTEWRVDALRLKACALLGAWATARPTAIAVGEHEVDSALLVGTAALEITVHGWDVSQSTGQRAAVPEELARGLLPVAADVVHAEDRGRRFAPALQVAADASYGARLLAFLGRGDQTPDLTGPPGASCRESPAHPRAAS
jgi:uncharacterized protein (TIGR03086 family)